MPNFKDLSTRDKLIYSAARIMYRTGYTATVALVYISTSPNKTKEGKEMLAYFNSLNVVDYNDFVLELEQYYKEHYDGF